MVKARSAPAGQGQAPHPQGQAPRPQGQAPGPQAAGSAAGSWASSAATRRSMQGNRSRDTGPEVALRKLLFARGLRYRVGYKPIKGERITVDIAFLGPRVIVLVDGCFWHACPQHHRPPKTHCEYWEAKMARNQARDAHVTAALEQAGWTVLRFWEHEPAEQVAEQVTQLLKGRRRPAGDG